MAANVGLVEDLPVRERVVVATADPVAKLVGEAARGEPRDEACVVAVQQLLRVGLDVAARVAPVNLMRVGGAQRDDE